MKLLGLALGALLAATTAGAPAVVTADVVPPATPAQADKTITFSTKAKAVGDKYTTSEEMRTKFTVVVGNQTVNMEGVENEERKTEVLAVKDGLATKVRATYTKHTKDVKTDGKPKDERSPVAGKTYLVERKGDAIVVTDNAGKAVSAVEQKKIEGDYKRLGKPDEVTNALKSKPRKIGDKLDDVAAALAGQLKDRGSKAGSNVTVEQTKLVLSGTKRIDGADHAVLDLTMKLSGDEPNGKLTMTLGGQVFVRIDEASFGEIAVSGPITMTGKGADLRGTMSMKTKTAP